MGRGARWGMVDGLTRMGNINHKEHEEHEEDIRVSRTLCELGGLGGENLWTTKEAKGRERCERVVGRSGN